MSASSASVASGKTVVVLGKTTIHPHEIKPLMDIGRAMAIRGLHLITTKSVGAARVVADAYEAAGGTPEWFTSDNAATLLASADEVIAFTDMAFAKTLTERDPDWETRDWLVFHNRKATQQAQAMIATIMKERGTPLDSGTS